MMTITLDLPADMIATLRADAGTQGRPVEQVAAERLAAFYVDENEETAVEPAFKELEASRRRPFAEFAEEFTSRFNARYGTK